MQSSQATFHHGIHPKDNKRATEGVKLARMPFVERYVLPLNQHLGAPARAIVKVGDRVRRGELVAEATSFVSASIHSPVTGKISAVASRRHPNGQLATAVEVEADGYDSQRFEPQAPIDWKSLDRDAFVASVRASGMVGLGGAAFPTHVKFALPEGKSCERLVINGCECEPYLTCDHRLMLENADEVIRGALIATHHLGATGATIGVESNKPDALDALGEAAAAYAHIDVVGLRVKYPQGAEKMLIKAIFDRIVPAGKLPLDVGMVVNNVATIAALSRWFETRMPLIERAVTVSGPGIHFPANLIVPIGTPVRAVVEHCGGLKPETTLMVMGGPMMGQPLASLDAPVLKGTSGILALTAAEAGPELEYSCIRCGRCLTACANMLNPSRLARLSRANLREELELYNVNDCMECGACSFACPSGIPIVQLIRSAKAAIRAQKARE